MISSIITGKKLPKARSNKRTITYFKPSEFSGEDGNKLAAMLIFFTALAVAIPVLSYIFDKGYNGTIIFGSIYALGVLLITASEFYVEPTQDNQPE